MHALIAALDPSGDPRTGAPDPDSQAFHRVRDAIVRTSQPSGWRAMLRATRDFFQNILYIFDDVVQISGPVKLHWPDVRGSRPRMRKARVDGSQVCGRTRWMVAPPSRSTLKTVVRPSPASPLPHDVSPLGGSPWRNWFRLPMVSSALRCAAQVGGDRRHAVTAQWCLAQDGGGRSVGKSPDGTRRNGIEENLKVARRVGSLGRESSSLQGGGQSLAPVDGNTFRGPSTAKRLLSEEVGSAGYGMIQRAS